MGIGTTPVFFHFAIKAAGFKLLRSNPAAIFAKAHYLTKLFSRAEDHAGMAYFKVFTSARSVSALSPRR